LRVRRRRHPPRPAVRSRWLGNRSHW
jgi:hypothetical protein